MTGVVNEMDFWYSPVQGHVQYGTNAQSKQWHMARRKNVPAVSVSWDLIQTREMSWIQNLIV